MDSNKSFFIRDIIGDLINRGQHNGNFMNCLYGII